jgi:hypothetical protein
MSVEKGGESSLDHGCAADGGHDKQNQVKADHPEHHLLLTRCQRPALRLLRRRVRLATIIAVEVKEHCGASSFFQVLRTAQAYTGGAGFAKVSPLRPAQMRLTEDQA